MNTTVQKNDDRATEYVPYGSQDKIKLSLSLIQKFIATPTRSGRTCSERDALKFLMLCRARRLDPWQGDAFLIGYDGKDGPQFSLITAHQALVKRAELHPEFDGMKSGVIVRDGDELRDLEGDFHTEEQVLLGGWATVFFKQRKIASSDRLALRTFMKKNPDGSGQGRWKDDPAGMIVKIAESSALRKAFPTMCGGMFLREEISITDGLAALPIPNLDAISQDQGTKEPPDDSNPDLTATEPKPKPPGPADSPQGKLAALAQDNGLTFTAYQKWAEGSGNDAEAGSRSDWSEVPADLCNRYLRAKVGFIQGVKAAL